MLMVIAAHVIVAAFIIAWVCSGKAPETVLPAGWAEHQAWMQKQILRDQLRRALALEREERNRG